MLPVEQRHSRQRDRLANRLGGDFPMPLLDYRLPGNAAGDLLQDRVHGYARMAESQLAMEDSWFTLNIASQDNNHASTPLAHAEMKPLQHAL